MTDRSGVRERIAFLRKLRAVRQFRPEPIPQDVIADILEVARWSGRANNRQPWELVVIQERATLTALAGVDSYARHLADAALGTVLVMNSDSTRSIHETYDEGRLSERIMLAAAAHGIGACIGWFVGAGVDAAKTILGIPAQRLVRTAISLGYPDLAARRARPKALQPRKPLDAIVHYERYRQ